MSSLRGLILAIALPLLATVPVLAGLPAQAAQFSAEQTNDIRSIIKNYLMEHPEVIREAITELENREKTKEAEERSKALADQQGPLYNAPDGLVIGNPQGKITLIEFFDYNCGFCKKALPDLAQLMKDNKDLKVILRDFPILSPSSIDASLVAVAAHKQFTGDKFWEFHRRLLSERGLVGKEQALAIAKEMGADMKKLQDDAASPEVRKALQASLSIAKNLSLNGTPTYVLGNDILVGAVGFKQINDTITNVRKCGKAACS